MSILSWARRWLLDLAAGAPAVVVWLRRRSNAGGWIAGGLGLSLIAMWDRFLAPLADRLTVITAADMAYHSKLVGRRGLAAALPAVHPDLAWCGDGLSVPGPTVGDAVRTSGNGIWLVPSVFTWPRLVVDLRRPAPVLLYPARGSGRLWEAVDESPSHAEGLRLVLGRSRLDILTALSTPTTTTRLARRLGLAPGTISTHLSGLTRAGLLRSRRCGREVFYEHTALGRRLAASEAPA